MKTDFFQIWIVISGLLYFIIAVKVGVTEGEMAVRVTEESFQFTETSILAVVPPALS